MNVLYVDIDSLRPDHLGCYGYHRPTSPNIDRIAAEGVRFTNCYTSDAPCLPSRTALFSGLFGIHSGVVNHGGVASQPFLQGAGRGFRDWYGENSWPSRFRKLGYHTATISSFGERHSAWHWYAGFHEVFNSGLGGSESAEQIFPIARKWIEGRQASPQPWFMHLNFWDPHTPYRVPASYGNPFSEMPIPDWYSEDIRQAHWQGCGPHSAREVMGYSDEVPPYLQGRDLPRQPWRLDSMEDVRGVFDGYDTAVRYADDHLGKVLSVLEETGQLADTAIIISADHGENLGELNVYGDHQTADHVTCRLPLVIRWPGVTDSQAGRVDTALHYHFDFAATAVELAGGTMDAADARSFAGAFRQGDSAGRDSLVLSQGAWCVQRGVRWGEHLYLRTWHDAWHNFPSEMLFNVVTDPHELQNLAPGAEGELAKGRQILADWRQEMLAGSASGQDPLETVLSEGGSLHARENEGYLQRLRSTNRGAIAESFENRVNPFSHQNS